MSQPCISVTLEPASSAFFAGELMEWRITFKNERPPKQPIPSQHGRQVPHRHSHRSVSSVYSAPASRANFDGVEGFQDGRVTNTLKQHPAHQTIISPLTPTSRPSSSRSYFDVNNSSSTSTHIVLPERKGIIGSPLKSARRSISSTLVSPQYRHDAPTPATSGSNLTAVKALQHKKNDYSVAISHDDAFQTNPRRVTSFGLLTDEAEGEDGVLDLSSQLAGMALLRQRESVVAQSGIDGNNGVLGSPMPGQRSSLPRSVSDSTSLRSRENHQHLSIPRPDASTHPSRVPNDRDSQSPRSDGGSSRGTEYGTSKGAQFPAVGRSEGQPKPALPQLHLPRHSLAHGRSFSAASPLHPRSAPLALSSIAAHKMDDSDYEDGRETLLWAFAQFSGSFTVEESLVKNAEFLAIKHSLLGRHNMPSSSSPMNAGVSASVIGGGNLGTHVPNSTVSTSQRPRMGGWRSWMWRNTPEASLSKTQLVERRGLYIDPVVDTAADVRRRSSAAVTSASSSSVPSIGSLEETRLHALNDKSVPVYTSPPSILAVDLVLEPGESRSYKFSMQIPNDLPPSFRGKSISFNYVFKIGTNRCPRPGSAGDDLEYNKIVKVPVRVYNNVSVDGVRPFYDLTNPIVVHRDPAKVSITDGSPFPVPSASLARTERQRQPSHSASIAEQAQAAAQSKEQKEDFYEYATSLLQNVASASPQVGGFYADTAPSMARVRSSSDGPSSTNTAEKDEKSCKTAVEIVSRNAQKISYDINKDGYKIAVVTLVKSAFRLGDTVNFTLLLNLPASDTYGTIARAARVFRIAARLETHELVETTIAKKSPQQIQSLTRRLHAEHHETTLDSGRIGIALAIPSGATPDFASSGVKLQWTLRVSFLLLPPAGATGSGKEGLPDLHEHEKAEHLKGMLSPDQLRSANHAKSRSMAFGGTSLPGTPVPVDTMARSHFLPMPQLEPDQEYTAYRGVPDLSFVPTLFQTPDTLSSPGNSRKARQEETVVLLPAKIETVEVSIPLRVFPSATPFRPPIAVFSI